jgi:hypothetical protein
MIECNVSSLSHYELANVLDLLDLPSSIFSSNAITFSFMKIFEHPFTSIDPIKLVKGPK